MGCGVVEPTILYEDNDSTRAQTENPLHHKRTKHIDIAYHFTRQMVEEEVVKIVRINTGNQIADIITKPLGPTKFNKLYAMLSMRHTEFIQPLM